MIKIITAAVVLSVAISAQAQVLTSAETLGSGKQVVSISENRLYDKDVDLNVAYAMYGRGLNDRFDLFVGFGHTHILSEDQIWLAFGENVKLGNFGKTSFSVFTFTSIPLHRREDAANLLLSAALVISRPINDKLSLYSGLNALLPIGNRKRGLFTPPENKFNIPLGASVALGNYAIAAEVDVGRLKAVGIGLTRLF